MALSVISRPVGIVAELSAIAKIHKYKGLQDGHHFIPMAMEVHGALGHGMDHFIRERARLFLNRRLGGHLSLFFCIHFFKQCVSIVLQRALASTIERKITLANDVCSRPPTINRFHDLHVGDIRGVVGEKSHGFRLDHLCYTAFRQIKQKWRGDPLDNGV
jgi:hypothetical protein